jgi:hypothetical protein
MNVCQIESESRFCKGSALTEYSPTLGSLYL